MQETQNRPDTYFAPGKRSDVGQIMAAHQSILQADVVQSLIHSMQDLVLILNEHRQIVAVNKSLLNAMGIQDADQLLGKRPGEAMGCYNASVGPNGCGTAEVCSVCGAVLTILASQEQHKQVSGDCRITLEKNGGTALDLSVMATPIDLAGHHLTIFTLRDVSADHRRQTLERVFFHDILNTAGGIRGIAMLLNEELSPKKQVEFKQWMVGLSDTLIEDINHQRQLMAAERGDYQPVMAETDLTDLLQELTCLYEHHERTPNRTTHLGEHTPCTITTDRSILRRIVGNMILNALEASPSGGTVSINAQQHGERVRIEVINQGEIPRKTQLQLFKRSFSTKGASGRGIGTYSIKLFGERYLGGQVGFNSADGQTCFYIELPLTPAATT